VAKLTLIPTPIGNLGDITLRALETLEAVDAVAAEDTRHSGKLLAHFGIDKPLIRLDAHTIAQRAPQALQQYSHLGFVTDAGTPGVSDPGAELVVLALARGDAVEVLPGPTALIPALVLSGLPTNRFTFEGFLPRKGSARSARLKEIAGASTTTILYESPQRLLGTLSHLAEHCGGTRHVSVSRELSKLHETTYRGTLSEVLEQISEPVKGEIVIVIAPAEVVAPDEADFSSQADRLRAEGLSAREIRKVLETSGAPRNVAYALSLDK
jgi:16S rRNA (cytidine1402-2'-O)-methyltransferase